MATRTNSQGNSQLELHDLVPCPVIAFKSPGKDAHGDDVDYGSKAWTNYHYDIKHIVAPLGVVPHKLLEIESTFRSESLPEEACLVNLSSLGSFDHPLFYRKLRGFEDIDRQLASKAKKDAEKKWMKKSGGTGKRQFPLGPSGK